jgi:hypothetical protein
MVSLHLTGDFLIRGLERRDGQIPRDQGCGAISRGPQLDMEYQRPYGLGAKTSPKEKKREKVVRRENIFGFRKSPGPDSNH